MSYEFIRYVFRYTLYVWQLQTENKIRFTIRPGKAQIRGKSAKVGGGEH